MSETLAQKIRFYHANNPDWSSSMIAAVVGCGSEYVRSAIYRSGGNFGGNNQIVRRNTACRRAFEDPAGRKIATEEISEGMFWQAVDLLSRAVNGPWLGDDLEKARTLLSFNTQEPEK